MAKPNYAFEKRQKEIAKKKKKEEKRLQKLKSPESTDASEANVSETDGDTTD